MEAVNGANFNMINQIKGLIRRDIQIHTNGITLIPFFYKKRWNSADSFFPLKHRTRWKVIRRPVTTLME